MSITSLDDLMAGFKTPYTFVKGTSTMEASGRMHTLWYLAGMPGAATAPSSGMAGATCNETTAGALTFTNKIGDEQILSNLSCVAGLAGTLLVIDRLWEQSGIGVTTTTSQTVNSVTWPARDRNGATSGVDVLIALEVRTATTNAGTTSPTITYTNSAGTGSRTGTMGAGLTFPATAAAGTFVPFHLDAGDIGVQSVQSITLNTSLVTGAVHLVAFRVIAEIECLTPGLGQAKDAIALGKPIVYDGSCLQLVWIPSSTSAVQINGRYNFSDN